MGIWLCQKHFSEVTSAHLQPVKRLYILKLFFIDSSKIEWCCVFSLPNFESHAFYQLTMFIFLCPVADSIPAIVWITRGKQSSEKRLCRVASTVPWCSGRYPDPPWRTSQRKELQQQNKRRYRWYRSTSRSHFSAGKEPREGMMRIYSCAQMRLLQPMFSFAKIK